MANIFDSELGFGYFPNLVQRDNGVFDINPDTGLIGTPVESILQDNAPLVPPQIETDIPDPVNLDQGIPAPLVSPNPTPQTYTGVLPPTLQETLAARIGNAVRGGNPGAGTDPTNIPEAIQAVAETSRNLNNEVNQLAQPTTEPSFLERLISGGKGFLSNPQALAAASNALLNSAGQSPLQAIGNAIISGQNRIQELDDKAYEREGIELDRNLLRAQTLETLAKAQNGGNNKIAFGDTFKTPDGTLYQQYRENGQIFYRNASDNTVSNTLPENAFPVDNPPVDPNSTLYEVADREFIKQVGDDYKLYRDSKTQIGNALNIISLLNNRTNNAGAFADWKIAANKLASQFGINVETLANDQELVAELSSLVLDSLSAFKGAISDRDLAIAQAAAAGDINIQPATIMRVLSRITAQAYRGINEHNARVSNRIEDETRRNSYLVDLSNFTPEQIQQIESYNEIYQPTPEEINLGNELLSQASNAKTETTSIPDGTYRDADGKEYEMRNGVPYVDGKEVK